MEMGNQYGINMGNILSGASDIKTARLNLEKKQRVLDAEKAGERNIMRKLRKGNTKSDDISGTPSIKNANALNTSGETSYTEEEMRDIALNPTIYNQEQAQIKADAIKKQTFQANKQALRLSMPNATEAQIEVMATQESDNVIKFVDMIAKGDKVQAEKAMMAIDKNARIMMSVTQAGNGIKDPQAKQQAIQSAYTEARDAQIAQAATPEQREKISKSIPAMYNANWVAKKIAESETVFKFAEENRQEIVKQENRIALEKEQQKNKIKLEGVKQKNKIRLEDKKQEAPVEKSKKEFMQIMEILKNPNLQKEERDFYKARLTKLSQPDMKSKEVDINTANKIRGEFANKLNLENPYALSTIDVRNLSEEEQAEANTVGQNLVKLTGASGKIVDKKMATYGAMSEQATNALSLFENVGEFRLVDEKTKQYISNYTGLSKKELESTEATQAFQSLLNISIKADSGSAVSAQELVRKTAETATNTMTKSRIKLGIKNIAKRNIGELKGLKKVMGPTAFNLKYGGVLKNYEEIRDEAMKSTSSSSKPKTLEELRASKSQGNRTIVRTGKDAQGNKVVKYSDGTIERVSQ